MELIEWNYAYITDLVEFANDKEISKYLRYNCKVSSKKKKPILLVDTRYIDIYQFMKR